MRITELLKEEGIELGVTVNSKAEAVDFLVNLQEKAGNITDKELYKADIMAREENGSTAVGDGIAIPHAKSAAVKRPGLAAMTVPAGVDYDSLDGQASKLIFMIAAPKDGGDVHLEVLSRLMVLLMDEDFRSKLLNADNKQDFLKAIDNAEIAKFGDEVSAKKDSISEEGKKSGYRVLAVTACPTGIAHTYMAAEALEKAGNALGVALKAETNGSGGAKNVLTDEEIAACDGIIIAADKNVETARFDGKPVLFVKVSDGIHKPEELINKIINKEVPVYHEEGGKKISSGKDEGAGHKIYKHLMNGVSHMLPFVIGGGIMIALAFLLDDYAINPANFGMNTPAAAFFKTVGGAAFGFMLPILAAYIASSIADRPGLAPGFAGGVIAMNGTNFTGLAAGDTSGISGGFLAALLAGFVAGYVVKFLEKITEKLPKSMDGIRPMLIYPLGGILIIGAFMCAINPAMGWINTAISNWLNGMGDTSRVLLGIIVAGMMSVDMGGPVNKAAYVFGTASLATGNYDIMAAVMIGGMVPPIAIALSTTFFKKKWSAEDRRNGIVNYVMGLCFISEGAIPYAAKDPIRVIPSCIIGSAVSGALSMVFNCTLRAPHGGIFVFPVVGNPILYLVALAAGSIVGAVILSLLKKNISDN
ncbi:MAG: fructose-specific PTS transporter subunit EIIC [Clostridia bacterium]|nr:fructose-specific PTS transporter subunit EIIC [Clostridia bacterium]